MKYCNHQVSLTFSLEAHKEEGRRSHRSVETKLHTHPAKHTYTELSSTYFTTCFCFFKQELMCISHCRAALLKSFLVISNRNCRKKSEISALTAWEMT